MRDLLGPSLPSRVPGRGRLLASLRALLHRVHRFSQARATTDLEHRWAGTLADALDAAYVTALSAPGARAGLDAVDRRATIRRKTPAARRTAKATHLFDTEAPQPATGPLLTPLVNKT